MSPAGPAAPQQGYLGEPQAGPVPGYLQEPRAGAPPGAGPGGALGGMRAGRGGFRRTGGSRVLPMPNLGTLTMEQADALVAQLQQG